MTTKYAFRDAETGLFYLPRRKGLTADASKALTFSLLMFAEYWLQKPWCPAKSGTTIEQVEVAAVERTGRERRSEETKKNKEVMPSIFD